MDDTENNIPSPPPLCIPINLPEFSYYEFVLVEYKKCLLILSILLILIYCGIMYLVFRVPSEQMSFLVAFIVSFPILFFVLLIIQCFACGLKICIDNVNKQLLFRIIGPSITRCCTNKQFSFSDIDRIVYNTHEEVGLNEISYSSIKIAVIKRDKTEVSIYNNKKGGPCADNTNDEDVAEALDFMNNQIEMFNRNQNNQSYY